MNKYKQQTMYFMFHAPCISRCFRCSGMSLRTNEIWRNIKTRSRAPRARHIVARTAGPTRGMGTDLRPNHTAMATRVGLPPVQQHTHTRRPHATHRTSTSLPHSWTMQIGHRFTAKRKGLGVQQGLPAPHPPMRAHANP